MIDAPSSPQISNQLLRRLTETQLGLLAPHLEPVEFVPRMVLERPGRPIEHAYFPDSGLLSIIAHGHKDRRIEVGLVGRDGVTALAVLMGSDRSPHEVFVQATGTGHRIASGVLRTAMDNEGVRGVLLRYAHSFLVQTTYAALANGRYVLEERLARWLLMYHDRLEGDLLEVTHEFLSVMLGVRRAGVTVALNSLVEQGLIGIGRGYAHVLNRQGLEAKARGLYGVPEAEYARLMGEHPGQGGTPTSSRTNGSSHSEEPPSSKRASPR